MLHDRSRVLLLLRRTWDRNDPGELAIVVTSAGVIGHVAANLLGLGVEQWVRLNRVCVNAGVTTVAGGRRGLSLVTFNEHAHLSLGEVTYR